MIKIMSMSAMMKSAVTSILSTVITTSVGTTTTSTSSILPSAETIKKRAVPITIRVMIRMCVVIECCNNDDKYNHEEDK